MIQFTFPILVIVMACILGYRENSLTFSGAVFAFIVGLSIYLGLGVGGLLLLGIFFVSSSFWSKYKSNMKTKTEEKLAKGTRRDGRQVLANGCMASILSIFFYFTKNPIWIFGFAVAIASSNSDTWASEIGVLSRENPISIRNMKRIEKGTSGAVSILGSVAGFLGSFLIGFFSFFIFHLDFALCMAITFWGFAGNLIDTLLGAFFQQLYVCDICGIETEKKIHCHRPTMKLKGFTRFDNDMVNFLSGCIAVILAICFYEI